MSNGSRPVRGRGSVHEPNVSKSLRIGSTVPVNEIPRPIVRVLRSWRLHACHVWKSRVKIQENFLSPGSIPQNSSLLLGNWIRFRYPAILHDFATWPYDISLVIYASTKISFPPKIYPRSFNSEYCHRRKIKSHRGFSFQRCFYTLRAFVIVNIYKPSMLSVVNRFLINKQIRFAAS